MAEKRIIDFASRTTVLAADSIPFWKASNNSTSRITFADFMQSVMSSIAENGIVGKAPDGHYYKFTPDNSGVLTATEDLGITYP